MVGKPATSILVVDDNPATLYATSRLLRSADFDVVEAATGTEGLTIAIGQNISLVVLDVNLPDVDGFEVCRIIRSNPKTARLPVIHLSATFVSDPWRVRGYEAGADGYLTHPVEPTVLIGAVNAFLRTRAAEEEMRDSEAKFRAIFQDALEGIAILNDDLTFRDVNRALCKLLCRSREELIESGVFATETGDASPKAIDASLGARGFWRGTTTHDCPDETRIDLDWRVSRYSVPGSRLAFVSDITEQKRLAAQRELLLKSEQGARASAEAANRMKDDFLATLSHELRSPLHAIVGWTEVLRLQNQGNEELLRGLTTIKRNADFQKQLVDDLLDLSLATSGKLRLSFEPTDIRDSVSAAVENLKDMASAKNVTITRSESSPLPWVSADPVRVQQILVNLLGNAIKFSRSGGRIFLSVTGNAAKIELSVRDEGRGITANVLPHIFERFWQEDTSSRRASGGLGLGLAIVRHLVEAHGGSIIAESDGPDCGATFTISLPAIPAEAAAGKGSSPSERSRPPSNESSDSLMGLRILLVDDDVDGRQSVEQLFARLGAELLGVSSAAEALAAAQDFKPDLVISDLAMPHENGFDLLALFRAQGYHREALPILALSAVARREDQERALNAGFDAFLAKPLDPVELMRTVSKFGARTRHRKAIHGPTAVSLIEEQKAAQP
ncbi:MAG: response regulator [Gemmatimonadaceae bacterium]